jgi:eukaryotic-like serine/threonine-protein kinase
VPALVLELVEGDTLTDRIARGPVPPAEALAIARQIVDALDTAHEKGIVHRDLKPANIKITPDGVVKVLDFGLAKATAGDRPGPDLTQSPRMTVGGTREGVILGTAAYMSPEQARGQTVDKRTDIWAFGCVLYEMLAGRPAFARETITDTLAAVVGGDTNWKRLPVDTPAGVRKVLRRCLDRDPRRRMRDIGEARFELDEAVAPGPDADPLPPSDPSSRRHSWHSIALIALGAVAGGGALAAIALGVRGRADVPTPIDSMARTIATRLTRYGGNETYSALSPDGRTFVFVSDHGGSPDIWLRQVSGGEPVRLTNDPLEERDLAYTPDGESIYFTRIDPSGSAIWQIGALGGQPRKILADAFKAVPAPDGRSLAYFYLDPDNTALWALGVSALNDARRRPVARNLGRTRAAWSRDGRWLSYTRGTLFGPVNLFVIEIGTGRERQVTHFTRGNEGLTRGPTDGCLQWLPDNRHLLVSYLPVARQQAANDLGILDVQTGTIARVTISDSAGFAHATVSADGSRLVATRLQFLAEVWKVPLGPDADASGKAAVRLMDGRDEAMWTFVSRDGRLLLFNGTATGNRNLWLTHLNDGTPPRQVTTLPNDVVSHSSLSPNGSRVAFAATTTGNSDIWTQHVDGSDLRQLTNDEAADSWPVWSPDGQSLVFTSDRENRRETWRIPAAGGRAERVIDGSFRGDWIVDRDGRELIVTSNGGTALRLIDVARRAVVWDKPLARTGFGLPLFSPDGRSISILVRETRDRDAIHILDVATGASRVAVRLPFHFLFRASWVDDGRAFIVNRFDQMSHIVMFDHFWKNDPAK